MNISFFKTTSIILLMSGLMGSSLMATEEETTKDSVKFTCAKKAWKDGEQTQAIDLLESAGIKGHVPSQIKYIEYLRELFEEYKIKKEYINSIIEKSQNFYHVNMISLYTSGIPADRLKAIPLEFNFLQVMEALEPTVLLPFEGGFYMHTLPHHTSKLVPLINNKLEDLTSHTPKLVSLINNKVGKLTDNQALYISNCFNKSLNNIVILQRRLFMENYSQKGIYDSLISDISERVLLLHTIYGKWISASPKEKSISATPKEESVPPTIKLLRFFFRTFGKGYQKEAFPFSSNQEDLAILNYSRGAKWGDRVSLQAIEEIMASKFSGSLGEEDLEKIVGFEELPEASSPPKTPPQERRKI